VVGVPLKIGGTVSDPELSMTGAALTGAAIGSAVLPGVGTAIGARVGQQVEKLFGGDTEKKPPPKPRKPPVSQR
jgi:phage tail tape-measure protein